MMRRGFSGSSFCSPWALLLVVFPPVVNFRFLDFLPPPLVQVSTVAIVCVPCEQATVFLAGLFMQCNGRLFLDASTVQEGKKKHLVPTSYDTDQVSNHESIHECVPFSCCFCPNRAELAWRTSRKNQIPGRIYSQQFLEIGELAWCAGTLQLQNSLAKFIS